MFTNGQNQDKAMQTPNRFKCSLCLEYKNQEHFSNKELMTVKFKKQLNPSLSGTSAKLRCRACTVSQRQELECERCGEVKDIYKFSKSSRKAGGNHWCIECTVWKEGANPMPADEQAQDWENDTMVRQMSRATISSSTVSTSRPATVLNKGKQSFATTPTFGQNRNQDRPTVTPAEYVPPHLRGSEKPVRSGVDENKSEFSASNAYGVSASDLTSAAGDGWKEVDTRRRQQTFNAWGHDGQMQQRVTSIPSSVTRTPAPLVNVPSAAGPATSRRGEWAKPIGNRTQQEVPSAAAIPVRRQRTYYDDDDSEDYDDP